MKWQITRRDLLFLVDTMMPGSDLERAADRARDDDELIEAMLDDDRLFQRLMTDEGVLALVSPWFFFAVLLRRTQRDLQREAFTMEKRDRQKVLLFDTDLVIDLLGQDAVQDYLATMLASFTKVGSLTIPVRRRKGIWRRYRTSDMDVEGLMRYSQSLDEHFHFEPYKRIGDVCLFLTGVFPEHLDAEHRYPMSGQLRPRSRGRVVRSREDYETHGRAFYRLAAEHERAKTEGLDHVLVLLSENFILAEKPLAFLANRYLGFSRNRLFDV